MPFPRNEDILGPSQPLEKFVAVGVGASRTNAENEGDAFARADRNGVRADGNESVVFRLESRRIQNMSRNYPANTPIISPIISPILKLSFLRRSLDKI